MTPAIFTVWSAGFPGSTASGFLVAAPENRVQIFSLCVIVFAELETVLFC